MTCALGSTGPLPAMAVAEGIRRSPAVLYLNIYIYKYINIRIYIYNIYTYHLHLFASHPLGDDFLRWNGACPWPSDLENGRSSAVRMGSDDLGPEKGVSTESE